MQKLKASAVDRLNAITQFNPSHKDTYEHCLILLERAGVRLDDELRRAIKQAGRELGLIPAEDSPKKDPPRLRIVVSN